MYDEEQGHHAAVKRRRNNGYSHEEEQKEEENMEGGVSRGLCGSRAFSVQWFLLHHRNWTNVL